MNSNPNDILIKDFCALDAFVVVIFLVGGSSLGERAVHKAA